MTSRTVPNLAFPAKHFEPDFRQRPRNAFLQSEDRALASDKQSQIVVPSNASIAGTTYTAVTPRCAEDCRTGPSATSN